MQRLILKNVYKEFKSKFSKKNEVIEIIRKIRDIMKRQSFFALENIAFEANSGEIIGIIGKNGSGKSTLLRTIAGIYVQEKGEIKTNGKIISLVGLTSGFKHRLTVKENIQICCSLFGIRSKEIKKRTSPILNFAELEEKTNQKFYQLSTGMQQRLAFSIAIHCDPEILLLDEVFEIGDESFKRKSANKIKELIKEKICVLLVSHDIEIIKKYCDKVILMDQGKILRLGDANKIAREYLNMS